MKIFTEPCVCGVCGGPGVARPDHLGYNWLGMLRHTDPKVCAQYLQERANKLEERERKVREAEGRLAAGGGDINAGGQ